MAIADAPALAEHRLRLYAQQAAFVRDAHRYAAFVGGLGSGKSVAGAAKALVQEFSRPVPTLGLVLAPTYPMLRDATWRTSLELWAPLIADVNRSLLQLRLRSGHEVLFRSADDPDRLRGPNAAWAWIDEACQCAPDTWRVVIGRLRQHGEAGRCWLTTTPNGFDWVWEVFRERATADTAVYRAATRQNPFVDPAFVAALESQYPSDYARQELGGEFVQLGAGLVKREWLQTVDTAPADLRWVRYWDLATSSKSSADYTASLRAAERDGVLYLDGGIRGRWEWPDARRVIVETMRSEAGTEVGVEQAGFQLAAVQELLRERETLRTPLKGVPVDRDKVSRALPWVAKAEAGLLRLVRGAWVRDFVDEVVQFPKGRHDDYVDAASGAVQMLATEGPPAAVAGADLPPEVYQSSRERYSSVWGHVRGSLYERATAHEFDDEDRSFRRL